MFHITILEALRAFGENPSSFLAQVAQESVQFVSEPRGLGFYIIRLVFIFLGLFLLGLTIYFLRNTSYLRFLILQDLVEFFTYRPYGIKRIGKSWDKILARLQTGDESEYKLAVIEAEDLLDDILKRMGYEGEDLGGRLSHLTAATLPNIRELWQAHQVRNNIVHDPDYRLSLDEARKTLEIYEKALRDLETLE